MYYFICDVIKYFGIVIGIVKHGPEWLITLKCFLIPSQIYDGPSPTSPVLYRLCGSTLPADTISSSNTLYVVLNSDGAAVGSGFSATFLSGEYAQQARHLSSDNYI